MKKSFTLLLLLFILFSCQNKAQQPQTNSNMTKQSIHSFVVTDIQGNQFDFSKLKGKKILIVNTASKCGLTPQYKDLQALHEKYQDKLVIVGFPANNFMSQEPGSNQDIATFCEVNYGVTFPMMAKISVKGEDMHEVYQFLTQKSLNGLKDSDVEWNFQKYLLDEQGFLLEVYSPRTQPTDPALVSSL